MKSLLIKILFCISLSLSAIIPFNTQAHPMKNSVFALATTAMVVMAIEGKEAVKKLGIASLAMVIALKINQHFA